MNREQRIQAAIEALPQATPGPWTRTHVRGSNFAVQAFEFCGVFLGDENVYPIFQRDTTAIDGSPVFTSPGNAQLIEAAPDLADEVVRQRAEIARLRDVIGRLLLSADAIWYEHHEGHDWPEAVDAAHSALKETT
jgi:hypothetical protein